MRYSSGNYLWQKNPRWPVLLFTGIFWFLYFNSARLLSYEVVRHVCVNLYALISCIRPQAFLLVLHSYLGWSVSSGEHLATVFPNFRPSITKLITLTGEKESPDKFQKNEGFLVYFNSQKVWDATSTDKNKSVQAIHFTSHSASIHPDT